MVDLITQHNIKWLAPSAIWDTQGNLDNDAVKAILNRPAILRFASDTFMEELMAALEFYPEKLIEWTAKPETWQRPMPIPEALPQLKINDPITLQDIKKKQKKIGLKSLLKIDRNEENPDNPENDTSEEKLVLKLYQPAHQRFYLVATSLICRRFGLPDRTIDSGKQEKAGFVVRRLIHPDTDDKHLKCDVANFTEYDEYAYVMTPKGNAWLNITKDPIYTVSDLIPEEERLPLFAVNFNTEEKRKRRLLAGLIPVGNRESYINASKAPPSTASTQGSNDDREESVPDLRMVIFESKVISPWQALLRQAADTIERLDIKKASNPFGGGINEDDEKRFIAEKKMVIDKNREQIQTISWYILLDFAQFLKDHLNTVWEMVLDDKYTEPFPDPDFEQKVFNALFNTKISELSPLKTKLDEIAALNSSISEVPTSLRDALAYMASEEIMQDLEDIETPYKLNEEDAPYERTGEDVKNWPPFLFPLADPEYPQDYFFPDSLNTGYCENPLDYLQNLSAQVEAALPPEKAIPDPETLHSEWQILDTREGWFMIRCVYERPNCGPLNPPAVSNPTEPFQLASFFDPEAPARRNLIPMPMDISPAGLRKFKKNTGLMLSDMLCGQVARIRKITLGDLVLSVLPWPFHKDLPDPVGGTGCPDTASPNFGMICSLSIPIVTLCALILLIIIVYLFDQFFRWVPLLFTCFPLPGFEGKKK